MIFALHQSMVKAPQRRRLGYHGHFTQPVPSQYFVRSDLRVFSIACEIAFAQGETGMSFTLLFRSNSRPPGVVRLTLPRTEDHLGGARVATRIILRSTGVLHPSPQIAHYHHGVAERFVGEFHEPAKRLIHIENQKNCSGDRKGTYAQCRHRDEVPGRKKPEASE